MKNYGKITADEMLKNQVNMAHEFNPLLSSINMKRDVFTNGLIEVNNSVIDTLWREIKNLKGRTPDFVELSCKNCGAKIQQKYEDQIIKCPYCKSVYIIGTWRVNET